MGVSWFQVPKPTWPLDGPHKVTGHHFFAHAPQVDPKSGNEVTLSWHTCECHAAIHILLVGQENRDAGAALTQMACLGVSATIWWPSSSCLVSHDDKMRSPVIVIAQKINLPCGH